MEKKSFTWIEFYMELADRLLEYRSDRKTLLEKVKRTYERIGMDIPKLDSSGYPEDIDPYTVFGLFNKGIPEPDRKKISASLAEEFSMSAHVPEDFDGIPRVFRAKATFYAFSNDSRRGGADIDNLWAVFSAEISLASNDSEKTRKEFSEAFDAALAQCGLGQAKLTMGIYWARPERFVSMDFPNRWFLGDMAYAGQAISDSFPKENGSALPDGSAYLSICDVVLSCLGSAECPYESLPSLSEAAFEEYERVKKERKAAEKEFDKEAEESALGDADVETPHYWLYAPGEAASMWDEFYKGAVMGLGWSAIGDLSKFQSKEELRLKLVDSSENDTSHKNDALAVWQFVHDVKVGDVVFAKQGRSKIIGRGIVTGGYLYDESKGKYPSTRTVNWTHKGEWRSDEKFATKTLTDVTDSPELVAKIESLFERDSEGVIDEAPAADYDSYKKVDFLSKVFCIDEAGYDALVGVLRAKKNVILQGAPGVGKTFAAKRLAYSMMGVKDDNRVMMVQFHQSYSYEDFIEGYRPSADGFELAKGPFYTFCKRAADDGENDYFFIIDEINRGNLSKIFGELFMLIEGDKRGPRNELQLLYSRELFSVPSNVYLIGTMNTADRSLAMLDYALRRRFAFFDLEPGFDTDGFVKYRKSFSSPKLDALVSCVSKLNDAIAADESLGKGFAIGHSYFCSLGDQESLDSRLSGIVEYELVPMVREYWFDDQAKVAEWSEALRRAIK